MKEGQIFIEGEITPDVYDSVRRQLAQTSQAESLVVHIASPGGSVYDGYKIYHALMASGKPITCIIEGEAQSMATFISLAGKTIEIKDPSRYMIHNPSQGIKGDSEMLKTGYEELVKIEDEMAQAYSAKTKIPIDKIKEMMKKTTIMTAQEARQYGFVDKVSNYLRAVAIGQPMKKTKGKNIVTKFVEALVGEVDNSPVALDIPLQDGTVMTSSADSEDTINGSTVTLNGAPVPDGDYVAADGTTITVANSIVVNVIDPNDASAAIASLESQLSQLKAKIGQTKKTEVKIPVKPAPVPMKTAEADQIAALQAELAALKAEKEKLVAEKTTVETTTATVLSELKTQIQALEKKTVGDPSAPDTGNLPIRQPIGRGNPSAAAAHLGMSRKFLHDFMPWIEQYYPESEVESWAKGPNAISILETNFNYTYPGITTTDIFYKPTLSTPALSDMFTIDQGIQFQKKYNLVTQLSNLLQPYGGCTRVFNGNRQLVTNTTVLVKEFQLSESWCKDDFTGQLTGVYNILAQEWLKTGNRSFDPSGTPIQTVIDTLLTDALRRDVFQRATMAAGNSSSSNYNQIDGLWDRLIDSSGASNYCVVRGGAALGVATLAAGAALTALEAVYAASNNLLKEMIGKAVFWVTGSVYDNYVQSLVGNGQVSNQQFLNLTAGFGNQTAGGGITYKGIEIRPVRFWDSSLADTNNPLNATTRHLILLTVKENHILGVEQGSDLNRIDGWYERKDRKFYYESDMKFGYNYLHCDLQAIAY